MDGPRLTSQRRSHRASRRLIRGPGWPFTLSLFGSLFGSLPAAEAPALAQDGQPGATGRQRSLLRKGSKKMKPDAANPPLPAGLIAELDQIRRAPSESVGFGEKAFIPYEPNVGQELIRSGVPGVTARLLAEALGDGDRVYRLAVLHVLGKRSSADVDAALLRALEAPALRATAAYLLGRAGYRGYPARARDERSVRAALGRHLGDPSTFDDPFYRRSFRTQDFILCAYVRVVGPGRFHIADPTLSDLIGYALPALGDAVREDLLAQAAAMK
jgi:hypothetical protein